MLPILPPGHKFDLNQSIKFILLKVANDSLLMRNEMACNLRQPASSYRVSLKETAFVLLCHPNLRKKKFKIGENIKKTFFLKDLNSGKIYLGNPEINNFKSLEYKGKRKSSIIRVNSI